LSLLEAMQVEVEESKIAIKNRVGVQAEGFAGFSYGFLVLP